MIPTLRSVLPPLIGGNLVILANGLVATLAGVRLQGLGIPTWLAGLVLSAYFAGQVLGALMCERVIRRVGHIRTFAAYVGLLTAVTLTHSLVVHPLLWLLLRGVAGFAVAMLLAVTESWLNARSTVHTRGVVLAVYMTSVQASIAAGQFGLLGLELGHALVFVAPAVLYSLSLMPVALTREYQPDIPEPYRLLLREYLRRVPLGVTGTLLAGTVTGTLYSLGAIFAREVGLRDREVALFMGGLFLGGMMLQFPLGRLSDRMDRRRVIAGVGVALVAVTVGLFVADFRDLGALLPLVGIVSGLAFVIYPLALAHTNDWLDEGEILPAAGLAILLYAGGASVGPILASAAMSSLGPRGLFGFLALAGALLSVHAVTRIVRVPPVAEEQREEYQMVTYPTAAPTSTGLFPAVEPEAEAGAESAWAADEDEDEGEGEWEWEWVEVDEEEGDAEDGDAKGAVPGADAEEPGADGRDVESDVEEQGDEGDPTTATGNPRTGGSDPQ